MDKIKNVSFESVSQLEKQVAEFFGAPYAIAVDSCTHGIELCLRYVNAEFIDIPKRTYISVPFLANKLNIKLSFVDENWENYYCLWNDDDKAIYDAAVLWKKDSYISGTMMSLSFQYQKHLSLGRGGMILCDNEDDALMLKKMSYDGRLPNIPWREQDIDTIGYHYYMTPETAALGLEKLPLAIDEKPKQWVVTDWPDVSNFSVFK